MSRTNQHTTTPCPRCSGTARIHGPDQHGLRHDGYCPTCRLKDNSTGQQKWLQEGHTWQLVWSAPNANRERAHCHTCHTELHHNNRSGYCKACKPKQAVQLREGACDYRNCRKTFTYKPWGMRGAPGRLLFCSRECNRREHNRRAQETNRDGKPTRRNIKPNTRLRIAYQHGYKCAHCKKTLRLDVVAPKTNAMQIDHIIEVCNGGTDDDANLQPLCVPCHKKKHVGAAAQLRAL